MRKNIAVIEYASDVDQALRHFRPEETTFLAVSAEASYRLERERLAFITDEDILSPDEFKEIGTENFIRAERATEFLEETLAGLLPEREGIPFTPFRWHFYRLKILFDAVTIRHKILSTILTRNEPAVLGIPSGDNRLSRMSDDLFFGRYDSIYGRLGRVLGAERKISLIEWRRVSAVRRIPQLMQLPADLYRHIVSLRQRLRSSVRTYPSGVRNILVSCLGYDIALLMARMETEHHFFHYERPAVIRDLNTGGIISSPEQRAALPFTIDAHAGQVPLTGIRGIDELLRERFHSFITNMLPVLWRGRETLRDTDRAYNFDALLTVGGSFNAAMGLPLQHFISSGKPAIIVQHGGYGFTYNALTRYADFGHDGYYLAWGKGIPHLYQPHARGRCRFVVTGSAGIAAVRQQRRPRQTMKSVCYIPTLYRGNTAYYPHGQPALDAGLFRLETDFLTQLKPFQERYLITYKAPPGWRRPSEMLGANPLIPWIKSELPKVRIEFTPLSKVINDFDCFLLDWPSTTLVQICATNARIVVYAGNSYQPLTPEALPLLRKRATVSLTPEDFKTAIRDTLISPPLMDNEPDDEFLCRYGISSAQGSPLERMTSAIDGILKNNVSN